MSDLDRIIDACRAGAASFDPDTAWWEMFWSAAGVGALVFGLAVFLGFLAWVSAQ